MNSVFNIQHKNQTALYGPIGLGMSEKVREEYNFDLSNEKHNTAKGKN